MSQDEKLALEKLIVDNEDLARLELLLSQFNIFEAIGVTRQEIRHSKFLAFLLAPSQTHQLSDIFLKCFLKQVLLSADKPPVNPVEIDIASFTDAEVETESEHIDILVYSPANKIVCVIENKVGSKEHSNQLSRYYEYVIKNKKYSGCKCIFIYLTPQGYQPESEVDKEVWLNCRYKNVVEIIDSICQDYQSTIGNELYILMQHYNNLLRSHVVGDSEIAELCQKIYTQHKKALDLIYEHRPMLENQIADYIKELIQAHDSYGLKFDYHKKQKNKRWIRFKINEWDNFPSLINCEEWTKSKLILLFEFFIDASVVEFHLTIGPGSISIKESIYQAINKYNVPGLTGDQPHKEEGWIYAIEHIIIENITLDDSIDEIKAEIQSFWNNFLLRELPLIKKAITEEFTPQSSQVIH